MSHAGVHNCDDRELKQAMTEETLPLTAAAVRMRRSRERRRRGLLPVNITLRDREIAGLVRRNLLAPAAVRDKTAVRKAMHDWLNTGVLR
jgi:hypothetical protein